jgi:hypothetical protein
MKTSGEDYMTVRKGVRAFIHALRPFCPSPQALAHDGSMTGEYHSDDAKPRCKHEIIGNMRVIIERRHVSDELTTYGVIVNGDTCHCQVLTPTTDRSPHSSTHHPDTSCRRSLAVILEFGLSNALRGSWWFPMSYLVCSRFNATSGPGPTAWVCGLEVPVRCEVNHPESLLHTLIDSIQPRCKLCATSTAVAEHAHRNPVRPETDSRP